MVTKCETCLSTEPQSRILLSKSRRYPCL